MTIQELRELRAKKVAEADKLNADEKNWTTEKRSESQAAFEAIMDEIKTIDQDISRAQAVLTANAQNQAHMKELPSAAGADITVGADREAERPFANFGEQLVAVRRADTSKGQDVDKRLLAINERTRIQAAASGMNEEVPSEGGWAVQKEFAGMIFESAATSGQILQRIDNYEVGMGFNAVRWIDIDERDISTDVFGGVRVYRVASATAPTETKPKLKERELKLLKLAGLAYATDELEQDTTFISDLYSRAFELAIQRTLEGEVVSGNGATECLGILKGGDIVSIAKESTQKPDTVIYNNFVKAWTRMNPEARTRAVWLVHPDVEEQMMFMQFPVGTGGVPVFLPAGGASATPYSTLFGKPVIPTDHCSALGDQGDVILADLFMYIMARKGGTRTATSMHVNFTTFEMAYRFEFRANGAPKNQYPVTIKNSSNARANFVTIDAR